MACFGLFDSKKWLHLVPVLFGISAWLGVNSTFLQLPIIVKDAPEGWNLPSYIVVLVQMGNLGPIIYRVIQKFMKVRDAYLVYFLLCIGMLGSIVAASFYNHTTYAFGTDRSLHLFAAVFLFAFLDCSSTVIFMPYMGRFLEPFLISYLTGVSVGGLIPSIASLVQGAAEYGHSCASNQTIEDVSHVAAEPRFGVSTFFILTCSIYLISIGAFYCIDTLKVFKQQHANVTIGYGNEYTFNTVEATTTPGSTVINRSDANDGDQNDNNKIETIAIKSETEAGNEQDTQMTTTENTEGEQLKKLSPANYRNLMIFATFMSFIYNAVLPSVQTYSTLPYGSMTYHFSVVFSYICNTLAYVSTNFIKHSSLRMIFSLAAFQLVPASYVMAVALMSPNPPFIGSNLGSVLIVSTSDSSCNVKLILLMLLQVISWSIAFSMFGFLNLSVLSIVRGQGGRSLVRVGEFTQLGAFSGSVLSFIVINLTDTFKQHNPCES